MARRHPSSWRDLRLIAHLYTKGPATGVTQFLLDDMFSAAGQAAAAALKFVALSEMTPETLTAYQAL